MSIDAAIFSKTGSEWLSEVLAANGWECLNCEQWRILKDREVERCPTCGDEEFDVYDTADTIDQDRSTQTRAPTRAEAGS